MQSPGSLVRSTSDGAFAFAVFGDGPYYPDEMARFEHVLDEVRRSDVEWLIHVGDILWNPCTDEALEERLASLNSIQERCRPDVREPYPPGNVSAHLTLAG